MGIPNNSEEVHKRNAVLYKIRSRISRTGKNKLMQCPGFKIHPCQEFRINAKIVELVGGTPRIGDCTAGRISVKTCPKIQQEREEQGVCSKRPSTSEGSREYVRCQCREINADLGKAL